MWDLRFPVWAYGLYVLYCTVLLCTVLVLYSYSADSTVWYDGTGTAVPVPVPVPYYGLRSQESTVPYRYYRTVPVQSQESTVRYQRPEAYCGLLSSGCGHEVSWEIPGVAYIRCVFSTKIAVPVYRF